MVSLDALSPLVVALFGAGAFLLVAALSSLAIMSGRQRRRDLRDIVAAIEELRTGRALRRLELDPRSRHAAVADAVNRLAQDLTARFTEAEIADEGLRAILDAARDYAIVAADADWDVRTVSPGATAMFALEPDAIVGRSAAALFDEASWKELIPKFARRNLRERGVDGRFTMVRRDGTRFPARVAVRPHRGPAGESAGFLLVLHDVSSEVRLESDLRESEERYRRLVEGLPEAVAVLRGGLVVYANPAFAALLGARSGEAAGLRLRDRVETSDVLVLQDAIERLEAAPEGERAELRLRLSGVREGAGPAVRVAVTAVRHDGDPAVLAAFRDETAERRVEAELRRNEARLDALVEAAAEGLVVLADAPSGAVVTMANAAFSRMTGLDRARVLGASASSLAAMLRERGAGGARLASLLAEAGMRATPSSVDLEGTAGTRTVDAVVSPLHGFSGRVEGRVVALRDRSDAQAAESSLRASVDDLRRAKDELEAAYRELQGERQDAGRREDELSRLNRELRSLDAMKSDLLANVSHELQTPLVSIRGYTEMILKERLGPVNDEQRKGLSLALRNIDRLIGLIDNLLQFSRVDRGAAELNVSVFPVARVVDEATDLLRDRLVARRLSVSKSFEDQDATIRGDRDKILQVFLNLLSNAVKFNREGGRIEVVVRRGKPGFALVQVHDTGVGIPEKDLDRIFDRFYRVEAREEPPREGTGIGLAIVRGILRQHGCVIQASSQVGEGATFTFTLPLAEGGPEQGAHPEPPAEAASADGRGTEPAVPPTAPGAGAPDAPDAARPRLRIIRKS